MRSISTIAYSYIFVSLLLGWTGFAFAKNDHIGEESDDTVQRQQQQQQQQQEQQQQQQQEQQQQEQVCTADGQCHVDDQAAQAYYGGTGVDVDITPYGVAQQVAGNEWKGTMEVLEKMQTYMADVWKNETMRKTRKECQCRHKMCSFWASIGECEANPKYMKMHCPPSCQSCEELAFEHRCPFDPTAPLIWEKGDLNRFFERITTDTYYVERFRPTIYSRDPWIVTLENVATEIECESMIEAGQVEGYERSKDVGAQKFDGTYDAKESKDRTSANAWCLGDCYDDPHHQRVLQVVENVTAIPNNHSEYWQLLKYNEGEFYHDHHDFVPFHLQRRQGPRILTVFLYLNNVEEGGGTRFTNLDITVQPRRGRATIWPSVLDQHPTRKDKRTNHEALPVLKGIKYGANAWIHARDFKTPFAEGCS